VECLHLLLPPLVCDPTMSAAPLHRGSVYGNVGYFSRRVERSLLQKVDRAALAMAMLEMVEQLFNVL